MAAGGPLALEKYQLSHIPEISLAFFTFSLNLFWGVAQTYFCRLEDFPFSTMLYSWLHRTRGDVVIAIGSFWLVGFVRCSRRWFLRLNKWNFAGFITAEPIWNLARDYLTVRHVQ